MSQTKQQMITAISDAMDNATSNSGNLSDAEQALVLQAAQDVITNHVTVINPNVRPTPTIKFS